MSQRLPLPRETDPTKLVVDCSERQVAFKWHVATISKVGELLIMARDIGEKTSKSELTAMIITKAVDYSDDELFRLLGRSEVSDAWRYRAAKKMASFWWNIPTIQILNTLEESLYYAGDQTSRAKLSDALITDSGYQADTLGDALSAYRSTTVGDVFPYLLEDTAVSIGDMSQQQEP